MDKSSTLFTVIHQRNLDFYFVIPESYMDPPSSQEEVVADSLTHRDAEVLQDLLNSSRSPYG